MVKQWMILLSFASLAFGVTLREDDDRVEELGEEKEEDNKEITEEGMYSLPLECCDYEKVLPKIFTTDKNKCAGAIVNFLNSEGEGRTECATKCAFGELGLLNENESVKEPELRKLFMDQTDSDTEEVLQTALDLCYGELKLFKSVKDKPCPSGADKPFKCIADVIATGCPEKFWHAEKENCEALRDKHWRKFLLLMTD